MNSNLIAFAVSSTLLISYATASLAATYKTLNNQVVVTGLQPKTKYPVQTINFQGRNSTRNIITNSCGEALIINGTGYQRLLINNQNIIPSTLKVEEHKRCTVRRNNTRTTIQQVIPR